MVAKKSSSTDSSKWDEVIEAIKSHKDCRSHRCSSTGNAVYGLGLLGAAFYYFQHMPASSDLVLTIFRIIFWPAVLVYELLSRSIL